MDKTYTLEEIRPFYPRNLVEAHHDGFLIYPATYDNLPSRQGREILMIPYIIPTIYIGNGSFRPFDYTLKWNDSVVSQLLPALEAGDYKDLYAAYCRFGIFWKGPTGLRFFHTTDPQQATHIQLIGIKDQVSDAGWMPAVNETELRLDYISADHYCDHIPFTDEDVHGWILDCEFRTKDIQEECSKRFAAAQQLSFTTNPNPATGVNVIQLPQP